MRQVNDVRHDSGEERFFAFRFDVDTVRCAAEGMPNLVKMAEGLRVPLTFFVNFGRTISYRPLLEKVLCQKGGKRERKLGVLAKLGPRYFMDTVFCNPVLVDRCREHVAEAFGRGHEVGLHGGRNHARWQAYADTWRTEVFRSEVQWGIVQCLKCGIRKPEAFASPGWRGNPLLYDVLADEKFRYTADRYDAESDGPVPPGSGERLLEVPTNIVGEGGVGYIESLRAYGFSDQEILSDFRMRLAGKRCAIAYDHPCLAGTTELYIVAKMIEEAIALGFTVATISTIIRRMT